VIHRCYFFAQSSSISRHRRANTLLS
jgi:hypothetical protein